MNGQIPNRIFKYRSFDNKGYFRDLLKNNELYFSSPIKFNDPFDCRVVPNYEIGSRKDIYNKLYEYNGIDYPKFSAIELRKKTDKDFAENYKIIKNPDLFAKRVNEMMDQIIGIFTMTEDNSNILMWSHYSDSHKGFCIEFNAGRLFEICNNYIRIGDLILTKKVKYSPTYPKNNPYTIFKKYEAYEDWLTVKSMDWKYEKEWRLLYAKHPNEKVQFPDDIFKAIYFGVQCSDKHIEEVFELTKTKKINIKYYKAKLRRYDFGIEFTDI